jgi:hypothetical protein
MGIDYDEMKATYAEEKAKLEGIFAEWGIPPGATTMASAVVPTPTNRPLISAQHEQNLNREIERIQRELGEFHNTIDQARRKWMSKELPRYQADPVLKSAPKPQATPVSTPSIATASPGTDKKAGLPTQISELSAAVKQIRLLLEALQPQIKQVQQLAVGAAPSPAVIKTF